MYVIPIQVPILTDGPIPAVSVTWARSLELLRDSLQGRYGPIAVVAPSAGNAICEPVAAALEDILLVPVDLNPGIREFWQHGRPTWETNLERILPTARVMHTTVGYTWRPLSLLGHRAALRAGIPTVFVQDGDKSQVIRQTGGIGSSAHAAVHRQMVIYGARTSTLTLLKGSDLMEKYATRAPRAMEFLDTSYTGSQVIANIDLQRRLANRSGVLRLVYAGRLVRIKRVDIAIRLIADARRDGMTVSLDIYGDGPERKPLAALAKDLGLENAVQFHGYLDYGALLIKLRAYDAQILPSSLDETPRSVFDGFAAGLPLLAASTPYTRTRATQDRAVILLDSPSPTASMKRLLDRIVDLSNSARVAAIRNSADVWYARRAAATFEAID